MQGAAQTAEQEPAGGSVLLRHIRQPSLQRAESRAGDARAPDPPPALTPRTPERAIASAIGRAADRTHGLPLFFDKVDTGHAVLAELAEILPERALISVVEGPGDALGVVAICPGLLTSVIEMQAVGRISARPPSARRPTRTDGAICADFLNACLAEIGAELTGQPGFNGLADYRYASFVDDPRPLELMLDDVPFRRISLTLRAGPVGQRDGQMLLLLPAAPTAAALTAQDMAQNDGAMVPDAVSLPPEGVLAAAVHAAPITLHGVLCRRLISLGELRALTPGALIALPHDALGGATLETATGQPLLRGKLGELAGRHAIRLQPSQQSAEHAPHLTTDASEPEFAPGGFAAALTEDDADADPIDLDQPDPFRPDVIDLAPIGDAAALDFPTSDLSAWEDEDPVPLAPLSIG